MADQDQQPQRIRMVAPLVRRPLAIAPIVRNPTPEDLDNLGELLLDAYRGTIDASGGETLTDAVGEMRSYFSGESGTPLLSCSYIAEEDDFLTSASLISLYQDEPLLAYSFTGPEWKGQGLATALIQLSMNALISNGYKTLGLWVTRGNDPAEHVYAKLGFQTV